MTEVALDQRRPPSFAARIRWRRVGLVLLGWAGFLGVWKLASEYLLNPFILPGPVKVGEAMWDLLVTGEVFQHFQWSLGKTFTGFGFAIAIGMPIGFAMGRTRYFRAFFHDPVMVLGSVPGITYAVLALVIFGISLEGPVLAVALIAMPYIAINVAAGLDGIDRNLITMSRAFGRSRSHVLRHVLVPSVAPFVFAGVRLSFAIAWKVEALTEVFGSSNGIGFMIRRSYQLFSITHVLAWMLFFVVFMLLMERLVLLRIERHLFRWRPQEAGA